MNKYKYLGKNIGVLTIGSFGTKLLSFFLVPLYTNILSTTEYGIFDMFNTTISLLIPILTINIHDSVLRFSLENTEENRVCIFSAGLRMVLLSSIVIGVFTAFNSSFRFLGLIDKYPVYFVMLYFTTAVYQLVSNYARGVEQILDVSVAGVISAVSGMLLNVYLLSMVKIGLDGYFIAAIASSLLPTCYLSVRLHIYKAITWRGLDRRVWKELILYSTPLMLNAIGWWINSASDRYAVMLLCGVAANGVYSVGYKIPSILNVFQNIFNQAWVLSSVREFDPDDSDGFFSRTYSLYNALLVIVCAMIIGFNKILAFFLYRKDFYAAWEYVPYLTIAIIFGALSGYVGGVFSAVKDSKIFGISTLVGAAVNLALNFILVYHIGPIGAAISTAVSYCLVWILRLICVRKYISFRINIIRDVISYMLLLTMTIIVHAYNDSVGKYVLIIAIIIMITMLFISDLKGLCRNPSCTPTDEN